MDPSLESSVNWDFTVNGPEKMKLDPSEILRPRN